jgi:hypothetical protein
MSGIQQSLLRDEGAENLEAIVFGEQGEYRAWPSGLIETRRSKPKSNTLTDNWVPCNTAKYSTDKHGGYYWNVGCVWNGKTSVRTHVVMCSLFKGPRPGPLYEVNHIDGNRDNNSAANLEWVTKRENILNAKERGAFSNFPLRGAFINDDICRALTISTLLNAGATNTDVARWFGSKDVSEVSRYKSGKHAASRYVWQTLNRFNKQDVFAIDLPDSAWDRLQEERGEATTSKEKLRAMIEYFEGGS